MRVAVFTNRFPSRISTFFARDMRALLNAGLDVEIFAFYPHEPDLWRYVPSILDESVFPKSNVHHLTLGRSLRHAFNGIEKLGTFLQDARAICSSAANFGSRRLLKTTYVLLKGLAWARLCQRRYDHVLAYWGNYAATCAYTFHRMSGQSIPFSMFLHAGMDLYEGQVFLKEKLLYADNVFVVCDFNRQFLSEHYHDVFPEILPKIHKYHLGLDLAEFDYDTSRRSGNIILAVGALEKYKGFDCLLRAGQILNDRQIDFEINLVGDGSEAKSLKTLASELHIENKVKFRGWFTPDDVRKVMKEATILVHPSNGLGDAVPTVIKESMALGTPVVASKIAGIPELLNEGRCGVLVPPTSPQELANGIAPLLLNEELRRRYAEAGRHYAEEKFDLWRNGHELANRIRSTPPKS